MVRKGVDKKQEARMRGVDYFTCLLEDDDPEECDRELSDALKNFATKYWQLSMEGTKFSEPWHDYFAMGLKKFVRDMPSTTPDLDKALAALNREEVAADAPARGVNIQILPGPPAGNDKTPKAPAPHQNGMDKTPKAPAPHQNGNQNANGKRPAENQAEGKSSAATEAQDCQGPAKRVQHEAETDRGGFTVETEGSLTVRISDDTRTTTFNLNGRGPAIVAVNVQKKATSALASTTALASTNGNKEAEKEGAA